MRHKYQLLCFVVLSTFLFTGCTTIAPKVHLDSYRLENPEVASTALKVNIATGLVTETQLTVQDTTGDNDDGADINLLGQLGMTVAKGLQFTLSNTSSMARLSAKYQFYGNNADLATQGNFSQAISLGYANGETSNEELMPGAYESDAQNYFAWDLETHTIDVAWILGYRITHNFMIYGGPFVGYSMSKGTRFKDSPQFEKTLNLSGYMPGANLAFEYRFDMGLALSLEALTYENRWEGGKYSFSDSVLNFKIDYQF
ncbi:hypothetical protein AADZ84_04415 [Colwelliaceae bacterium MEBiC 14330]